MVVVGTHTPDGGRSAKRRNGLFGFCTIHDEIHSDTPLSRGKEDLNVWKNKLFFKKFDSNLIAGTIHKISMAKSRSHMSQPILTFHYVSQMLRRKFSFSILMRA